MRATTAFNKILAIPGAHVTAVTFTPDGVVVDLGRRAKRLRCPYGWSTRAVYDRSRRSWRGLDLGGDLWVNGQVTTRGIRGASRLLGWAMPRRYLARLGEVHQLRVRKLLEVHAPAVGGREHLDIQGLLGT